MNEPITAAQAAELRGELAELRAEVNSRFAELEERLNTRIAAAEDQTRLHAGDDREAFAALRGEFAAVKEAVLEQSSSNAADSMAQMHVLGLVARKVKVDPKALKRALAKVRVEL